MKNRNLVVSVLLLACGCKGVYAQGFATPDRRYAPSYRVAPPVAPASYWVERDPRYQSALPQVRQTSYANTAYRPVAPAPNCSTPIRGDYSPAYGGQYRAPLPRGYYKADGLFGKDTVFAESQPLRNFFRYLFP
jgi:hypothetical protein